MLTWLLCLFKKLGSHLPTPPLPLPPPLPAHSLPVPDDSIRQGFERAFGDQEFAARAKQAGG